jgi:tRNA (guanine37-N1)-methyltransferase
MLLSGHHADIEVWRRREVLRATMEKRPELVREARDGGRLSARDEQFLREFAHKGVAESESAA